MREYRIHLAMSILAWLASGSFVILAFLTIWSHGPSLLAVIFGVGVAMLAYQANKIQHDAALIKSVIESEARQAH